MILKVKNSAGTLGLGYNDHLRNCFQELCAIVSQKHLFPTWLQMEDLLSIHGASWHFYLVVAMNILHTLY